MTEPAAPGPGPVKIRKNYTITKSRESWTEAEHALFLEALAMCGAPAAQRPGLEAPIFRAPTGAELRPWRSRFDRDWRKIESHIVTKTVIQARGSGVRGVAMSAGLRRHRSHRARRFAATRRSIF